MIEVAERIRQGNYSICDKQLIESLLEDCKVDKLTDVIGAYIKYVSNIDEDKIIRCAMIMNNSGYVAEVIIGLGLKGGRTNGYDHLLLQCLYHEFSDFCDEAKIAALHNLHPSIIPISHKLADAIRRYWLSENKFTSDAAFVAAQRYEGINSLNIEWNSHQSVDRVSNAKYMESWLEKWKLR